MNPHTDSEIVEWNEDGSRTITTVQTIHPATTAQKAQAWGVLGLITVAPIVPLLVVVALDKIESRREAKRRAKQLKSVD